MRCLLLWQKPVPREGLQENPLPEKVQDVPSPTQHLMLSLPLSLCTHCSYSLTRPFLLLIAEVQP